MAIRSVPAGNGINWVVEAIRLILKNPAPFALMGLVVAIAGMIPLLGSLALAIVGPALYGGIAWAARAQQQGEGARFEYLFQAFQEEGRIGPMLVLCLPGVVGGVIAAIVVVIAAVIMLAGAGVSAAADSMAALWTSLGVGGFFILLIVLAVMLAAFAMTFFAIPDVMLARREPFEAMKHSARACLANVGAVLLSLLTLFVPVIVVMILFALIIPILGQLLVSVALAPTIGVSAYLAWKDVYGEVTQELPQLGDDEQDGGGIVA